MKRRWVKIAASKANYQQKKLQVNFYRRGKYALNEPKAYSRHKYAVELQRKLILTKTVCRLTARRLVDRVCKKRRERVGQLLKCVRPFRYQDKIWEKDGTLLHQSHSFMIQHTCLSSGTMLYQWMRMDDVALLRKWVTETRIQCALKMEMHRGV